MPNEAEWRDLLKYSVLLTKVAGCYRGFLDYAIDNFATLKEHFENVVRTHRVLTAADAFARNDGALPFVITFAPN
jgi:hypothetical protein